MKGKKQPRGKKSERPQSETSDSRLARNSRDAVKQFSVAILGLADKSTHPNDRINGINFLRDFRARNRRVRELLGVLHEPLSELRPLLYQEVELEDPR